MKKLLAAKRRSQVLTATTELDSDACDSVRSPDPEEWLEPQPVPSAMKKLEQKDRGQSLEEEAGHRIDDAGDSNSLVVTSGASTNDASSGTSGVADDRDKAMDKKILKEVRLYLIYFERLFL